MTRSIGLRRTAVWAADRPVRALWAVLAPAAGVWATIDQGGDWIAGTLFISACLSWSAVLLPSAVRQVAAPFVAAIAALSGGLLSLFLADPTASSPKNANELGLVLWALLTSGTAALYAQISKQRDSANTERALRGQLAAQQSELRQGREAQAEILAGLRRLDALTTRQKFWGRRVG